LAYRTTGGGPSVLYFEAGKRTSGSETTLRIAVTGWLRLTPAGSVVPIGIEAYVAFDEGLQPGEAAEVSDRIPLGILNVSDQVVWVMEAPSGETNAFVFSEIGTASARDLLVVDAGGC
jgi:hypothetical protein